MCIFLFRSLCCHYRNHLSFGSLVLLYLLFDGLCRLSGTTFVACTVLRFSCKYFVQELIVQTWCKSWHDNMQNRIYCRSGSTSGISFSKKKVFVQSWFDLHVCVTQWVGCDAALLVSFSFCKCLLVVGEAEWTWGIEYVHRSEQANQGMWLIIRENEERRANCTWEREEKKSCFAQWLLFHLYAIPLCLRSLLPMEV